MDLDIEPCIIAFAVLLTPGHGHLVASGRGVLYRARLVVLRTDPYDVLPRRTRSVGESTYSK